MICQNCKQRTAKIHLTKVVNDKRIDLHLCEICAKDNSQIGYEYPFNINSFLSGLFDIPVSYQVRGEAEEKTLFKCNSCGLTFEEFKKNGKLGCVECYNAFSDKLLPILKRIHGNVYHSGKLPQRIGGAIKVRREIDKLRAQLNKAVKEEEYEVAAQIRDKIKGLENSIEEVKG